MPSPTSLVNAVFYFLLLLFLITCTRWLPVIVLYLLYLLPAQPLALFSCRLQLWIIGWSVVWRTWLHLQRGFCAHKHSYRICVAWWTDTGTGQVFTSWDNCHHRITVSALLLLAQYTAFFGRKRFLFLSYKQIMLKPPDVKNGAEDRFAFPWVPSVIFYLLLIYNCLATICQECWMEWTQWQDSEGSSLVHLFTVKRQGDIYR